jgi:hypothetical protein
VKILQTNPELDLYQDHFEDFWKTGRQVPFQSTYDALLKKKKNVYTTRKKYWYRL